MQFRCLLKFMTWLLTESPEYKTKQIPDPSLPHNLICCVKPMATAPYSPYTANKVCPLVQQNTPCCLPSDTGSHSVTVSRPAFFALGLIISKCCMYKHTYFDYKYISSMKNKGLTNFQ